MDVANIHQPPPVPADISLPPSLTSSDQSSTGIQAGLLSVPSPHSHTPSAVAPTLIGSAPPVASLPPSVPLPPLATPLSSVTSSDAVLPFAVSGLAPGAPDCRSDPPPQPLLPQSQPLPPQSLSPPPSSPLSVPLPPLATPLPSAASSPDAALPPAAAGLTPGGPVGRSDPLPPPDGRLLRPRQPLPSPSLPPPPSSSVPCRRCTRRQPGTEIVEIFILQKLPCARVWPFQYPPTLTD